MSRAAVILAILVPIPALLSAQVAERAAPTLEGCYRLSLGDWEPALPAANAVARRDTCPEWLQRLPEPEPRP